MPQSNLCPTEEKKLLHLTLFRAALLLLVLSALLEEVDSANVATRKKTNKIAARKACPWEQESGHPWAAGVMLRCQAVLARGHSHPRAEKDSNPESRGCPGWAEELSRS